VVSRTFDVVNKRPTQRGPSSDQQINGVLDPVSRLRVGLAEAFEPKIHLAV
jgi:hypothetical protein